MAYTKFNYASKKALKLAAETSDVSVFQPGPFGPEVKDGTVALEGPHYPEAHRWYATAKVVDGKIVRGSVK